MNFIDDVINIEVQAIFILVLVQNEGFRYFSLRRGSKYWFHCCDNPLPFFNLSICVGGSTTRNLFMAIDPFSLFYPTDMNHWRRKKRKINRRSASFTPRPMTRFLKITPSPLLVVAGCLSTIEEFSSQFGFNLAFFNVSLFMKFLISLIILEWAITSDVVIRMHILVVDRISVSSRPQNASRPFCVFTNNVPKLICFLN